MSTAAQLLERYVDAKDLNRPELMAEIYAPDAVLTYSIATQAISFPARVAGSEGITRTLVSDFALRFSRCRTYYVCAAPPHDTDTTAVVPWLVVMREEAVGCLRMGKGWYRWSFRPRADAGLCVSAMHIHIARMDPIADPQGRLLESIQGALPYPWLHPATLASAFAGLLRANRELAFLEDFRTPLDPPPLEE